MKVLHVFFHGLHTPEPLIMGRLAYRHGVAAFEFSPDFLSRNIHVSPFRLPLQTGLIEGERGNLDGLHGLFHDSLPDGWGLLLMDRGLRARGIDPSKLSPVDRVAFIGSRGMGALSYQPDEGLKTAMTSTHDIDLAKAGSEATKIYEGSLDEGSDYHTIHGTPSGGARPKLLVGIDANGNAIAGSEDLPPDYNHWIVKFPTGTTPEQKAEGAMEDVYAQMARASGIDMAESQLIHTVDGSAYFATKRFDRVANNIRNHVHSVAGLLNNNFRFPSLDYVELIKLPLKLTKSVAAQREMFHRMLFNVVTGNMDDHTKNFAFMMMPDAEWTTTPAYDVTFNPGMGGEHNMTIAGRGKNVTLDDLLAVGEHASLNKAGVLSLLDRVREGTASFPELSKDYGLPRGLSKQISIYITNQLDNLTPLQIAAYEKHKRSTGDDLDDSAVTPRPKGPRLS